MATILTYIVVGLIVGLLARLVLPGRQAIGLLWTIVIGIAGAVIGGMIGERISPDGNVHWILSVLVAVGLLVLWGTAGGRTRSRV